MERDKEHETHLKGNMIIAYPDLQLLLADDVLLWPVGVVFSVDHNSG